MKLRKWTPADLDDRANWDFSFCDELPQNGKHMIWEFEIGREVHSTRKPACTVKRILDEARHATSDAPTLRDVSFSTIMSLSCLGPDSYIEPVPPEELLFRTHLRLPEDCACHLIELDYSLSDTELRRQFAAWLTQKRKQLGLPEPHKGRRQNRTSEVGEWLEDLAIYRFRAAGLNATEASDRGFKLKWRTKANQSSTFKRGEENTLQRIKWMVQE